MANIGELVDIRPSGLAVTSSQRTILLRAEKVEIARLVVPAGKEIPEHKAKGEIVVQCLEGRVAYNVFGKTLTLEPESCSTCRWANRTRSRGSRTPACC